MLHYINAFEKSYLHTTERTLFLGFFRVALILLLLLFLLLLLLFAIHKYIQKTTKTTKNYFLRKYKI